jgi:hypothetical protein
MLSLHTPITDQLPSTDLFQEDHDHSFHEKEKKKPTVYHSKKVLDQSISNLSEGSVTSQIQPKLRTKSKDISSQLLKYAINARASGKENLKTQKKSKQYNGNNFFLKGYVISTPPRRNVKVLVDDEDPKDEDYEPTFHIEDVGIKWTRQH